METQRKPKTFEYHGHPVTLSANKYFTNESLAVLMHYEEDHSYDIITVNLQKKPLDNNHAYVDVNNMPDIYEWLKDNGIAGDTGLVGFSGFCIYPLMEFDLDSFFE